MKKRIIYSFFAYILVINANSQSNTTMAKADKEYENYAYVDAIKMYERLFNKGYKSVEMFQRLGNSYYFKSDFANASKWYGELFNYTKDNPSDYYYRYAQSLKAIQDYKKADEIMSIFIDKNENDLRSRLASSQKNYLDIIKRNSGRYTVENSGINSSSSDYGSSLYNDKLIFSSSRDSLKSKNKVHSWNGETFSDLYSAEIGADGNLFNPVFFGNKLNSQFHESTPVFTKDGKTVYFTRNNYLKKAGKDKNNTILLKIYKASVEGKEWGNITELPFNSNDYSVAHPALSVDEKTLYFSSNMTGSKGQSDIYKVAINSDGSFGTPVNLGEGINTEARETFPFISSDNELYFSSDGHPGLGGLDIFYSKMENDGTFKKVFNVGEPLNSSSDDFCFLINSSTKNGFISSNRSGGNGSDDIYKFKEIKKINTECEQVLTGIAKDEQTGLALPNAKVTLLDSSFKILKVVNSGFDGKFDFGVVDCGVKYIIKTEKVGHETIETPFITPNTSGTSEVPVLLSKPNVPISVGTNIANISSFDIKQIYFDLDKYYIRYDAEIELAKILDVLEQYPNMEISIRSHTDSRNSAKYNQTLSDRRAKATLDWLVSKGISKSRLTSKGYGETQLINYCSDGFSCSEEEHQANRRSEFIITKM